MRGVIRKEFRDLLPWLPVGLAVMSFLCYFATRSPTSGQLVEDTLLTMGGVGCALTATLIGFLQSIPDSRTEAKGFLVHRPISTAKIFWSKTAAGAIAYAICVVVPLLVTASYLEAQGPRRLPTCGMQALKLAIASIAIFAFHSATIWTVFRQVSWWNFTKVLPLTVPVLGIFAAAITAATPTLPMVCVALCIMFATLWLTLMAAKHAYCHEQFLPAPSAELGNSWSERIGLSAVCVLGAPMLLVLAIGAIGSTFSRPGVYSTSKVALSDNGDIWELRETVGAPTQVQYKGRQVTTSNNGDLNSASTAMAELPDDFEEAMLATFSSYRYPYGQPWAPQFQYMRVGITAGYLHRGQIYLYQQDQLQGGLRLSQIITPNGFYSPDDVPQGRFQGLRAATYANFSRLASNGQSRMLNALGQSFFVDAAGVYQINVTKQTVKTLLNDHVDQVCVASNEQLSVWTMTDGTINRYTLTPSVASEAFQDSLPMGPDGFVITYEHPLADAEKADSWEIEPLRNGNYESLQIGESSDHTTTMIRTARTSQKVSHQFKSYGPDHAIVRKGDFVLSPTEGPHLARTEWEVYAVPPGLVLLAASGAIRGPTAVQATTVLPHLLLALASVLLLSRWLGISIQRQMGWTLSACLCGIGIPIAMFCIYPRLIYEECHKCKAKRRIDLDQCETCGAAWDRAKRDGTEIFGPRMRMAEAVA